MTFVVIWDLLNQQHLTGLHEIADGLSRAILHPYAVEINPASDTVSGGVAAIPGSHMVPGTPDFAID